MLYIVTKVFVSSDGTYALEDVEVFSDRDTAKEYVRDLHDDTIEPLEGIRDITDDYKEGALEFEISHHEFGITVETSEREII